MSRLDLRDPTQRWTGFIKYWVWQLRTTDCDPALPMLNYIFKRQELNIEQRLWLCWLYGNTYYLPTSYVIWNEFPDYENVDIDRLRLWNTANYKRLRYQTDTKYNKGFLPEMFVSYRGVVGSSQCEFFKNLCCGSPVDNYHIVLRAVKQFYKFGRYTAWFYMQALKDCAGLPIEAPSLLLGKSGSESHTNGMCLVAGRDDLLTSWYDSQDKKHKRNVKYGESDVEFLEFQAKKILRIVRQEFPDVSPDLFLMETALCSFKKLFRVRQGRYLGYYLDRQVEEIRKVESDGWDGVDWEILHQYRLECLLPELSGRERSVNCDKMMQSCNEGHLPELEWYQDLLRN